MIDRTNSNSNQHYPKRSKSQCCGVKWACVCNAHEVRKNEEVWGKRRSTKRLNEYAFVVKPIREVFVEKWPLCVLLPAGIDQGTA